MKTIIINPTGGLANRMRAIASGISLSRALHLDCRIVWPLNKDLNCRFDKIFRPSVNLAEIRYVSSTADVFFFDDARKRNLYLAPLLSAGRYSLRITDETNMPDYCNDPACLENAVAKAADGDILIRSGVQFYDFDRSLYRALFRPSQDIVDEAAKRLEAGTGSFVGLHIRRTDNAVSIQRSPLHLFTDAIDSEIESDDTVRFYLATDSEDVKSMLNARYPGRIVYSPFKSARNTAEGIREALIEMVALSLCRKIYGSYWSSFSEAAAMIGDTPLTTLVV